MLDRLAWWIGAAILAVFGLAILLYVSLWIFEAAVRLLGLADLVLEFLRWRKAR